MKKLNPVNEIEKAVVKMIEENRPIHGIAREILIEMLLREEK